MKQPIKPEDIRKGDLIRFEFDPKEGRVCTATEYVAPKSQCTWGLGGQNYLLDRPEPPFEPYWGMVIVNPQNTEKAIYLPDSENDEYPWASTADSYFNDDYETTNWAKCKLAEGWVVIEKPEGVK